MLRPYVPTSAKSNDDDDEGSYRILYLTVVDLKGFLSQDLKQE